MPEWNLEFYFFFPYFKNEMINLDLDFIYLFLFFHLILQHLLISNQNFNTLDASLSYFI